MHSQFSRRTFLATSAAVAASSFNATSIFADNAPFRPKFSICNETFRDWPFDKAFAFAAECGYKGIEIAPFTISNYVTDVSAGKRKEIRKQAKAAGLDIIALHWLLARTKGLHLTSPDRDVRRKTSQYLGDLARFCADLGGDLLVFGSPRQRNLQEGVSRDDGFKFATEVIQEALPILEKVNVRLALEPLSHRITNFFATADEAVELIKRIDSPRCQLILDCVAMASESKTAVELIRQHHKRLVHFHANDPNSQGPGFGKLDFVPIFQALREVKFSGWVSVEVFDYAPGPERLAKESIQYMNKCVAKTK